MAIQVINGNGTFQLKSTSGYITHIAIASPGSSWTLQLKDGPDANGNFKTIFGATPFTIAAAQPFLLQHTFFFSNGIQVITAGTTPGELDIDYT